MQRARLYLVRGVVKTESKMMSTSGKKSVPVKVTTTVEVTEQVWAYRAEAN